MNSLNSILLEGNLTRDPDLNTTTKGAVCNLNIAVNRFDNVNDEWQKEVSYFDITCGGKLAVICGEFLKKGRGIRVIGRLKQNRWTDEENKERSRVIVVASHIEFKSIPPGKNHPTG